MDLDQASIERELAEGGTALGHPLVVVESTTSTNDDAKQAARDGAPSGSAFIADTQTGGRGRLGRSWHSPPGENLYASFVLRPSLSSSAAPLVTPGGWTGGRRRGRVARARTQRGPEMAERRSGRRSQVGRHLDRSAAFGLRASWIVVGVGINVRATSFPADIASRATSLVLAGATNLDRGSLFVALAVRCPHGSTALCTDGPGPIVEELAVRDALRGRTITVDGSPATALGIAEDGACAFAATTAPRRRYLRAKYVLGICTGSLGGRGVFFRTKTSQTRTPCANLKCVRSVAPCKPGAECCEEHGASWRYSSASLCLAEADGNGGGGGVSVAVDVVHDLVFRNAELFGDMLVDAHVGLVRNEQIDVGDRETGFVESPHAQPRAFGGGPTEHLFAVHPADSDDRRPSSRV